MLNADRAWLEEVEARCKKATALMGDGWEYDEDALMVYFSAGYVNTRQPIAAMRGGDFLMQYSGDALDAVLPQLHANGRFIASARTDIPRLIAMVRAGEVHAEVVHCVVCAKRNTCDCPMGYAVEWGIGNTSPGDDDYCSEGQRMDADAPERGKEGGE